MAFRWAGDANIAIAIELPAGGEHTRMVPKVKDVQVAGVARVSFTPLVPEIPGFGAVVVSLRCWPTPESRDTWDLFVIHAGQDMGDRHASPL